MIIEIDILKNKKSFIRRNKIKIEKIKNKSELPIFEKETIKLILLAEKKTKYSVRQILEKITPQKIIRELNKLKSTNTNYKDIKLFSKKITKEYIIKKLKQKHSSSDIPKKQSTEIETIGSIISSQSQKRKSTLHSEKHYMVDEIRNYFGETTKKGKGSFGFYLGFFNRVPKKVIYQYWAEVKQSGKPIKDQQKLFWWKIGQYLKKVRGSIR